MSIRLAKKCNLETAKIISVLDSACLARLAKLEVFRSIDSTNTYLLQMTKAEGFSQRVCFAEEQSAGRGRLGRVWYSPKGKNIYCSASWNFSAQNVSDLSLAVGVIIARVLKKIGVEKGVQLKWPNDILFAGRKLGGVLLERVGQVVVIGIGLNVELPKDADSELVANAIDLDEIIGEVDRNYLAGLLVQELMSALPIYADVGFKAFIDEWRQDDILFGKQVSVQMPADIFVGEARGINEEGELMVKSHQDQLHYFRCGEVSVRL